MPKTIDFKTVYTMINGEKVPVPALHGDPGSDAEVTSEKIEEALGYTPADESKTALKEDLSALEMVHTADISALNAKDAEQDLRLKKIEAAAEGNLYMFQQDDAEAYEKPVPTDALEWATIDKIGGKTLMWNQFIDYEKFTCSSVSISPSIDSDGVWTFPKSQDIAVVYFGYRIEPIANHKYFMSGDYFYNGTGSFSINWNNSVHATINPNENWQHFEKMYQPTTITTSLFYQVARIQNIAYGEEVKAKNLQLFDLTAMFGETIANSMTAEQFRAMFTADFYPFSEQTLMSYEPREVVNESKNMFCWGVSSKGSSKYCEAIDGSSWLLKGTVSTATWSEVSDYFTLLPGTYKIVSSCEYGDITGCYPALYSASNEVIAVVERLNGSKTFTVTSPTRCVIKMRSNATSYDGSAVIKFMLTKNLDATEYAPYRAPITTDLSALVQKYFPDGMKSAGTVYDEIDFERGVAVQRVGSYVIDSVNVAVNGAWGSSKPNAFYTTEGVRGCPIGKTSKNKTLCDRFYFVNGSYVDMPPMSYFGGSGATSTITYVLPENITTLSMALEWFESNPTTMFYGLPEPIETPIDPADIAKLNELSVETCGSLTFANQHGDDYHVPLPNSETWMIKLGGANA